MGVYPTLGLILGGKFGCNSWSKRGLSIKYFFDEISSNTLIILYLKMSKIVYLLGAGASYGKRNHDKDLPTSIIEGLPVVNEIDEQLKYVYNLIRETTFDEDLKKKFSERNNGISCEEAKEELLKWFVWLRENCSQHATIDTFAKELWLKNEKKDFVKVEFLLTSFFLILQLIIPYDRRYDTFLAKVLDQTLQIPDDIVILTWNYDNQFDIAYSQYSENHHIGKIAVKTLPILFDWEKKSIVKINGTANFYGDNRVDISEYKKKASPIQEIIYKILNIACSKRGIFEERISLNFAWRDNYFKNIQDETGSLINDAEVLIIIGYTYPFFNREIDRWILQKMQNLKKIYIQDPYNAENIRTNLLSVLRGRETLVKEAVPIEMKEEFFIPPEL